MLLTAIFALFLIEICVTNPLPDETIYNNIDKTLENLAKQCNHTNIPDIINANLGQCINVTASIRNFQCILFYDMSSRLCAANVSVKPDDDIQNIDELCKDAKLWNIDNSTQYPLYKTELEKVIKNPLQCARFCAVENITSDDSEYFCKYFNWGMNSLKVKNSPAESPSPQKQGSSQDHEGKPVSDNNKEDDKPNGEGTGSSTSLVTDQGNPGTVNDPQTTVDKDKETAKKSEPIKDEETGSFGVEKPETDDKPDLSNKKIKANGGTKIEKPANTKDIQTSKKKASPNPKAQNSKDPKINEELQEKEGAHEEKPNIYDVDDADSEPQGKNEPSMPDFVNEDDHFFSFFLMVIVFVVLTYIIYHNKNKVLKLFFGLLVEGRQNRRRNSRGHSYRRLDTLEQAMSSQSTTPPSKIIY